MVNIGKIVNAGIELTGNLIKKSSPIRKEVSSAIQDSDGKLIASMDAMALSAKAMVQRTAPKMSVDSRGREILDMMRQSSPERYDLILSALKKTTVEDISQCFLSDFIKELADLKDLTTLRKSINSGVRFKLVKSDGVASFNRYTLKNGKIDQVIILCEDFNGKNNVSSLPHELGHAFDYNTPTSKKLLHLVPVLKKDSNGKYLVGKHKCNLLGYKPNAYRFVTTANGQKKIVGVILDNMSMSEGFFKAYQKDLKHMMELDKIKGQKKGTTFLSLLTDWDKNGYFGYYLGAKEGRTKIDMGVLKKEMFAQLAAISTNGYSSRSDFDKKVLDYFPNLFEFVNDAIKKEHKEVYSFL